MCSPLTGTQAKGAWSSRRKVKTRWCRWQCGNCERQRRELPADAPSRCHFFHGPQSDVPPDKRDGDLRSSSVYRAEVELLTEPRPNRISKGHYRRRMVKGIAIRTNIRCFVIFCKGRQVPASCPECGSRIADKCPHCDAELPEYAPWAKACPKCGGQIRVDTSS